MAVIRASSFLPFTVPAFSAVLAVWKTQRRNAPAAASVTLPAFFASRRKPPSMDAYEVHKKIQEAIMAIEVDKVKSSSATSMWHKEIVEGLDELSKQRQALAASPKTAVKSEYARSELSFFRGKKRKVIVPALNPVQKIFTSLLSKEQRNRYGKTEFVQFSSNTFPSLSRIASS